MNTESLSKRRGRPAGSNSFARIRMVDLLKMVGENAVVPVSKVWLRNNGIEAVDIKVATVPQAIEHEPEENDAKIEFSLTSFD